MDRMSAYSLGTELIEKRTYITISGAWIKGTIPDTICSAAEKAMDGGSLPMRSSAMYSWSRMEGYNRPLEKWRP
jgi:hypothetical protein